jgi:hypothetical protein
MTKTESRNSELTDRAAPDEPDKLSVALDLLKKILQDGTNHNRRYCIHCKVSMKAPIELHKEDCVWRRAWRLVNDRKA